MCLICIKWGCSVAHLLCRLLQCFTNPWLGSRLCTISFISQRVWVVVLLCWSASAPGKLTVTLHSSLRSVFEDAGHSPLKEIPLFWMSTASRVERSLSWSRSHPSTNLMYKNVQREFLGNGIPAVFPIGNFSTALCPVGSLTVVRIWIQGSLLLATSNWQRQLDTEPRIVFASTVYAGRGSLILCYFLLKDKLAMILIAHSLLT